MRILLQLVVVLSGLLLAREFMPHSNEHLRLRAALGEYCFREHRHRAQAPTSVAPVAVGPIAEVSAQSIAPVHEAPALVPPVAVTPIAQVSAQGMATVHDEPPALLSPRPVAQIAQVSARSIATVRKPPSTSCDEEKVEPDSASLTERASAPWIIDQRWS